MVSFSHSSVAILSALFLGLVTVLSQTILLRELMIETGAFELVAAIALAFWMLFTGIGSILFRFLPSLRHRYSAPLLVTAIVLCFFGQLFLIRPITSFFTPVNGMALTIPAMVATTGIVLLPGCLLGGVAFPACVSSHASRSTSVITIYLVESAGMAVGAALFYFALDIFSPVSWEKYRRWYAKRYLPDILILSRDGRSGRLDIAQRKGQTVIFWNGQVAGVRGSQRQAEEFSRMALLQQPTARRILSIGGLLTGTAEEMARLVPTTSIATIEPEPRLDEIFPYETHQRNITLYYGEPSEIITVLPRHDLVILDLPDPSSLALSRWYTSEFFRTLRDFSSPQVVVVVGLSGGQGMLSPEIADLNASVSRALREVFDTVFLIPGSRHLWVATNATNISNNPEQLAKLLEEKNWSTTWVNRSFLEDLLEPMHRSLTEEAVNSSPVLPNRILAPTALFATLRHVARRLDQPLPPPVARLPEKPLFFFGVASFLTLLVGISVAHVSQRELGWARSLSIFAASGAAFTFEIALLSIFQSHIGQIYHFIALFTVSFTLGLTMGLWGTTRRKGTAVIPLGILATMTAVLLPFADTPLPPLVYMALNFSGGLLAGVSLGNLVPNEVPEKQTGAGFYLADLAGAAVCGLFFGAAVIPLYTVEATIVSAGILSLFGMFSAGLASD